MKEKLYTIPVNDAFKEDCECPICSMYHTLETNAIDFTMGPSYMEDDIREVTNEIGFCSKHIQQLYKNQNRLGLALMLSTHLEKTIKDIEELTSTTKVSASGLFKKKVTSNPIKSYIEKVNAHCFVCNRIEHVFERYLATVLYLYASDSDFRTTFTNSKGFCMTHYSMLYDLAATELSGSIQEDFYKDLHRLYIENMKRVHEDLVWFIDKFDYRYADEPWKNSKDALPRAVLKLNSQILE